MRSPLYVKHGIEARRGRIFSGDDEAPVQSGKGLADLGLFVHTWGGASSSSAMTHDTRIETIDLVPLNPPAPRPPPRPWYDPRAAGDWVLGNRWYVALVILPTALAALYFGLIAADRYESEARFVVRSPSAAAANPLSGLIGSSALRSSEDAHIVAAYMMSRDAVQRLKENAGLIERLTRPEADLLWSYPGLLWRRSDERLWQHFQRFIAIDHDKGTGITTLKVQAFRPEDARDLADALLAHSETLINSISERAHREALRTAQLETDRSREMARATLHKVTEFRRANELIDPGRSSAAALESITRLSLEIAKTNAELNELLQASPTSPQVASLRLRIAAFEEQIRKERASLAGSDTSLAPLIAQYERLILEREFAERTFAAAQTVLNSTRIDGERQRLFLERISSPALTDYPLYPYRLVSTLLIFLACWLLFAIARLLQADTRSHAGR